MQIITWDCDVPQPEDQEILLKNIIEDGTVDRGKSYCVDANYFKGGNLEQYFDKKRRQLVFCGASRGRYLIDGKRQDHKMKTAGLTTQRIEVRQDAKTNTVTTVQKDNLIGCVDITTNGEENINVIHREKSQTVVATLYKENVKSMLKRNKLGLCVQTGVADVNGHDILKRTYDIEGKSPAINACTGGNREPKITTSELTWRKLTPLECERLQTLPDFYTTEGLFIPEINQERCTKQHVVAIIKNKNKFYVGYNRCTTPQPECPRKDMKSGEGHHICREVCGQPHHAEEAACIKAGKNAKGGTLYLIGHTHHCNLCLKVMEEYGIEKTIIGRYPEIDISNTQRYRMLGNGFTSMVISHILSHILVGNRKIKS